MPTYLNNWNPKKYNWVNIAAESELTRTGVPVQLRWSAGGAKQIHPGDRVFLGRQGMPSKDNSLVRGIIASGIAVSPFFKAPRWDGQDKITTYNWINFDTILPIELVLPRNDISDGVLST